MADSEDVEMGGKSANSHHEPERMLAGALGALTSFSICSDRYAVDQIDTTDEDTAQKVINEGMDARSGT